MVTGAAVQRRSGAQENTSAKSDMKIVEVAIVIKASDFSLSLNCWSRGMHYSSRASKRVVIYKKYVMCLCSPVHR